MKVVLRSVSYFRQDSFMIAVLLLLIGASVGLNLLAAWPLAVLVDTIVSHSPKSSSPADLVVWLVGDNRVIQIVLIAASFFVIRLLQEVVGTTRAVLNAMIRYRGTRRIRAESFAKLQQLGLPWHRVRSQGDTIYRVINDTSGPWGVIDTLIGSTAAMVTLIAMTIIMLFRSVELTLFALAVVPFLLIANCYFGRLIKCCATKARERESIFTVTLQRAIASISVTQAFGREKREGAIFKKAIDGTVEAATSLAWAESLYPMAVQIIFATGAASIMGYGGWLVYRDQFLTPTPEGVTCGDLMVFLAYLGQLWDPMGWVLGFSTKIQNSVASCDRIFHILDQSAKVEETPNATALPVAQRTLSLHDVSFGYQSGAPVLQDLSASIEPFQMVAFVGPSGSGKSTVLSLLSRFYDPCAGSIRLDGIDIRNIRIADVRHHIAVVGQDSMLLPDTVAENLRYGRPDATDEELRFAAKDAGADAFIESLPDGYETYIAEGGSNFSGGQRQRLAIARALVSNAPILVLDEPTSALDPHHEGLILETLEGLRKKRTIVLVTHKLEAVAHCDRIFVMRDGRVVESGTHLHLLSQQGLYAEMLLGKSSRRLSAERSVRVAPTRERGKQRAVAARLSDRRVL